MAGLLGLLPDGLLQMFGQSVHPTHKLIQVSNASIMTIKLQNMPDGILAVGALILPIRC
jgi:hypothetical protein